MKCFFTERAVTIYPNGSIVPCCRFASTYYKTKNIDTTESIIDIKNSDIFTSVRDTLDASDWPIGCKRCKRDEELGITSRRQIYNEHHFKKGSRVADIAIGNFCNLKCIMCNSSNSTQWNKDQKMLLDNGIGEDMYSSPKNFFNRIISNESIDKVVDWIESEESDVEIELKGGEPLALPNSKYLFERLSSVKNNIVVVLTTNGTFFPEWLPKICEKIKIHISLSIDGLNEIYDYVRGSEKYSYELFNKNVQKFSQLPLSGMNFNYVVQNTNIHHLKPCIDVYNNRLVNVIFLQNPSWLQLWNMPEESKKVIKQQLLSIPKTYPKYHKIESVIKNIDKTCNKKEYDTFIKFSALLDKSRNKNLTSIAPHLFTKESLNEYNKYRYA